MITAQISGQVLSGLDGGTVAVYFLESYHC